MSIQIEVAHDTSESTIVPRINVTYIHATLCCHNYDFDLRIKNILSQKVCNYFITASLHIGPVNVKSVQNYIKFLI